VSGLVVGHIAASVAVNMVAHRRVDHVIP